MAETTKQAEAPSTPAGPSVYSVSVICVLAWMIPGLGHFLLKRPKIGAVFVISISLLFFWGLSLGARIYQYEPQQPLTLFALFAQAGMGFFYFLARFIASYSLGNVDSPFYGFAEAFQFGRGNVQNVTYEYGNTFTIVAGLLNFLVVLDAYDIAVGRKHKRDA